MYGDEYDGHDYPVYDKDTKTWSTWSSKAAAKAKPFAPHLFRNAITYNRSIPKILITREAYEKMYHYVDCWDKEIAWLGSVAILPSGDYLIEEVFLPKQEVNAATCELTPEGLTELALELIATRGETVGVDIVNRLNFWGHSHHTMGTSPSGQDDTQLRNFIGPGKDWFIRGIFNKDGRAEFTILINSLGIMINDLEWSIFNPAPVSDRTAIETEIKDKVKILGFNQQHKAKWDWEDNKKKQSGASTGATVTGTDRSSNRFNGSKTVKAYNPILKLWVELDNLQTLDKLAEFQEMLNKWEEAYQNASVVALGSPEGYEVVYDEKLCVHKLVEDGVTA